MLSNSFEVAEGVAHGGTDIFFAHDELLTADKSVLCWAEETKHADLSNVEIFPMQTRGVSNFFRKIGLTSKTSLSKSCRKSEE